ncbi:hypothetical protein [Azospirillum sp. SYSU D00513]|uniref:hypothetical protein n=1 Tax=Azospirillum sp. SYSU D00513 TaxID=2812561 RepID=UPI001A957736|nr:hypothetical protein [Azospirillum sp. SYSU D00513]
MLDDPEKTDRLLLALKAALPFEVRLTPMLAKHLQTSAAGVDGQGRHRVTQLSYLGDEGGIVCHLDPGGGKERLLASLTHLLLPPTNPLAAEVARYQKHRIKKLKKQGKG